MSYKIADCPECFGKKSANGKLAGCATCQYFESCQYCSEHDSNDCDKRSGHVSYDRYSFSKETADKPAESDDIEDLSASSNDNYALRQVMEFLLDIDNYTAELLHEVLHGDCNTTSALAKKFGISRQAVHRKIVDTCTIYPQLRSLFITRLYRCRRIMHNSARLEKQKNAKFNPLQQELF